MHDPTSFDAILFLAIMVLLFTFENWNKPERREHKNLWRDAFGRLGGATVITCGIYFVYVVLLSVVSIITHFP